MIFCDLFGFADDIFERSPRFLLGYGDFFRRLYLDNEQRAGESTKRKRVAKNHARILQKRLDGRKKGIFRRTKKRENSSNNKSGER